MGIVLSVFILVVSIFALAKSSDAFTVAVDRIGRAFSLPAFFTGVLFVAIGTSLPELLTGIFSVVKGETDMLAGNVIGSDIANVLLGLGAVIFISGKDVRFKQDILRGHFPVFLMAVAFAIFMMQDAVVTRIEGLFLIALMGSYLWFLFADKDMQQKTTTKAPKFEWKDVGIAVVSLAILLLSSSFLVDSVIEIALMLGQQFGVDENVLKTSFAATLVAVGTSLPEMAVVYSAVKKGNAEMAMGNIVGSNIFNIVLIMGTGALIAPLAISATTIGIMVPFLIITTLVYWVLAKTKEITRYEGLGMILLYLFFLGKLYGWL